MEKQVLESQYGMVRKIAETLDILGGKKVNWKKQGKLISVKDLNVPWMQSHTQCPIPYQMPDGNIRLYFNSRENGKTMPTYVDIDRKSMKVIYVNSKPLLELGKPGLHDDSGAMISSVIEHNGKIYMYYSGWNQGITYSYQLSIGLAISEDGGKTFHKYSKGPIMGRSIADPVSVGSPFVLKNDKEWVMYYISFMEWIKGKDKMEPIYNIKYATSDDGIHWSADFDNICIDGVDEAIAKPCVIKTDEKYQMRYSTRKTLDYRANKENTYRIGYAESLDGFQWVRKDGEAGIGLSESGWDSEMLAYAGVMKEKDQYIMFYNGNGFGVSGIGYAISEN